MKPKHLRYFSVLLIVLASTLISPSITNAYCETYFCNNTNPAEKNGTPCSADARTVATSTLNGVTIELRWSKLCGTNWARYISADGQSHQVNIYVERDDFATAFAPGGDVTRYTKDSYYSLQLYARYAKARACTKLFPVDMWRIPYLPIPFCTAFV